MEHHSATPAPAGLVSLAMACFTFFAIYAGLVDHSASPILAAWMLGAFVIQYATAQRELDHGALLGGNVFLYFSGFFCLATVFSLLIKFTYPLIFDGVVLDSRIEGWAWGACTLVLVLWTPAYYKTSNGCMGFIVTAVDVALIFLTLNDLKVVRGPVVNALIAWPLLAAGLMAIYFCTALQLNAAFEKTVLKIPGPFIKSKPKAEAEAK